MIALLLPLATRLVGERFAKAASWAFIALCVLGAIYAAYCWAWDKGRDHERARWEAASAKIEAADAKADAAGTTTAAKTKGEIDATNQRAADAARDSSDPLRDAFGELRKQGAGKGDQTAP